MRIAIVGTGAMGSVYAALLADAGNEVWAVDTWAEHIDAIRERGLRVSGASGDRVVRMPAATDPRDAGQVDLVVIATKAGDVEDAARSAAPLLGPETVVLPIQNGLGSVERVVAALGEEPVAVGVAGGFGASIEAPGHVHHNGMELLRLGERAGPVSERIERVADVWRGAGFTVATFDDVNKLVWEKLICNVAFSAVCALTGMSIGDVLDDPAAWSVAAGCAQEAYDVGWAHGVRPGFDDPVAYVHAFGTRIPGARPSMLQDVVARRRTEVAVISGAIGPRARAVGLRAPVCETVTALVQALEAGYDR
ncbi:MAG TPA: 2-dehydropantoate 2-reductase [Solirubrobacteraceae bacterium]|nr:2-dehydropantoate 2-reductase [Solirubrobacteraceae bacterium]